MSFNQVQDTVLKTVNNENIKKVDNFKYLRAWIDDTANDAKVRKALAWKSCNKLNKIWKSSLRKSLKLRTFLTLVESMLLYGGETWTLTRSLEQSIDGTYTRLLITVFNVSWLDHLKNRGLYGNLPKVTEKIMDAKTTSILILHCPYYKNERRILLASIRYIESSIFDQKESDIIKTLLYRNGYLRAEH